MYSKNQIEIESQRARDQDRKALFNAKRFFNQQESIELEIQDQESNRRFCSAFQTYDYYNGQVILLKDHFIRMLPLGERCFVFSSQQSTSLRTASNQTEKFKSNLPGGSKENPCGRCILDCVLVDKELYVLDLIQWGKIDFSDQCAEMRFFWMYSNLYNIKAEGYTFKLLFDFPSIYPAVNSQLPYQRGGLLFIRKDSFYQKGLNPECILFVDEYTHSTFREELREFKKSNTIKMSLSLREGVLRTSDQIEIGRCQLNCNKKIIVEAQIKLERVLVIEHYEQKQKELIEDPYSKLLYYSSLPELLFK